MGFMGSFLRPVRFKSIDEVIAVAVIVDSKNEGMSGRLTRTAIIYQGIFRRSDV